MPIAKKKPVPEFRSEEEERQFWDNHDSTEFIDWHTSKRRKFPKLKPALRNAPRVVTSTTRSEPRGR